MIESRLLISVGLSFLSICCGTSPGAATRTASDNPDVWFVTYCLGCRFGRSDRTTMGKDSVWSQNDDRDSVLVVVSGADRTVLSLVTITAFAIQRFEGDAYRNAEPREE